MYKKIGATQILKREICTSKMASKTEKTSHKNMENVPVMNVGNSPHFSTYGNYSDIHR